MRPAAARVASLVAAAAAAGASPLRGQAEGDLPAPALAVRAFFHALGEQRWTDAVLLLDLTDLDWYRHQVAVSSRRTPRSRELTVDDLLRGDPDMPRAVAEYQLKRLRAQRVNLVQHLSREFPGTREPAELDTLPLREVGIRWLQGQHPAYRAREQLRMNGCAVPAALDSAFRVSAIEITGTVVHQDTALVLFRSPWLAVPDTGFTGPTPLIARLRRHGDQWRVVARYDLVQSPNTMMGFVTCPADTLAPGGRPN